MSRKSEMARKFLELIGHLHRRGYQQLRIVPYVRDGPAPIWACDLAPASDFRLDHGALTSDFVDGPGFFSVRYVPYSPWPGFVEQSLEEAADYFLLEYRELAERSLGDDPEYVRWYDEMLAATAPKGRIAAIVYWEAPPERMYVFNVDEAEAIHVPLPPPRRT